MDDPSRTLLAIVLAALWCGFALYGLARLAARSPQGRELLARLCRGGRLVQSAALALFVAAVAFGGAKPGGGGSGGGPLGARIVPPAPPPEPAFGLVEVRTRSVAMRAEPTNAVEAAAWRRRGASEDGIWIERETPFFALGTNPVRRVYASASGALSFGSARHPALGAALPDGTGLPALLPFRAPLGILPASAEGTNAAPARFWHAPAPGGGMLVAWENVLVDRLPGRRATVQAELKPNGDFTYRYDFTDALEPPPMNFAIGAQAGTNAVNALAILGTNLLAETVWRVDGERVANGVSVVDLLCANGALRTPARFALEWKNTSGLDPDTDSDGDCLTDWDEVFRHGTDPRRYDTDGDGLSDGAEVLAGADPRDADEDGDGVPDGSDPAAWRAHRLWAADPATADWTIHLDADLPAGVRATLSIADLALPLRTATNFALRLPPGERLDVHLFSTGESPVPLRLSPAPRRARPARLRAPGRSGGGGAPAPRWREDPEGMLDGDTTGGDAAVAQPTLTLAPTDGNASECLHGGDDHRDYRFAVAPAGTGIGRDDATLDNLEPVGADAVRLEVDSDEPGAVAAGTATIAEALDYGSVSDTVWIHRCEGESERWCDWCHMMHGTDEKCWHEEDCPALTNALSECTCPPTVVRVATFMNDRAKRIALVGTSSCCCPPENAAVGATFRSASQNLRVYGPGGGLLRAGDDATGPLTVVGTGLSGATPSEIDYRILVPERDGSGNLVTNELPRTRKIWVANIRFEPVNTNEADGVLVNPCGVLRGRTARFRIDVAPAAFPDDSIVWNVSNPGALVPASGLRGREITVTGGVASGGSMLTVDIAGWDGPAPLANVHTLSSETVIPLHAWIVCGTNGPVTDATTVRAMVDRANDIYRQVGRRFALQEPVGFTATNQEWAVITKDTTGDWPAFRSLIDTHHVTTGVEVYFVTCICGAGGLSLPGGCAVRATSDPNTLAHELGHAQGLPDLFVQRNDGSYLSGPPSYEWLPGDFGADSGEGYYAVEAQSDVVRRMLMFERCSPEALDITTGDPWAFTRPVFTAAPLVETNAPAGFFRHASPDPHSN